MKYEDESYYLEQSDGTWLKTDETDIEVILSYPGRIAKGEFLNMIGGLNE